MILEVVFVAALLVTAFLSGVLYEVRLWNRDIALAERGKAASDAVAKRERDAFTCGFGNQTYAIPPDAQRVQFERDAEYSADGTKL
jgi:hypothetical protein